MLIEFTGCTGSGKTIISEIVVKKLVNLGIKTIAMHPKRFYLWGFRVKNESLQNIIMDFKSFPFVILSLKQYCNFLLFAMKILKRDADSFLRGLNCLRGIIRRLGTYEILRRKDLTDKIIVMDESTVHIAHLLFVHLTSHYRTEDIIKFVELVPLPDIAVCVRAPKPVLLERVFNRTDPPIKGVSQDELERLVNQACDVFEELCSIEKIRERLFIVDYYENSFELANVLGEQIVNHIVRVMKNDRF